MVDISYKWHPIEDLLPEEFLYVDSGLNGLVDVWNDQKKELTRKGVLDSFAQRLKRQWAIETGVIEHIYTLDIGITQVLIEKGIEANVITHEMTNKDPVLVQQIIKDQYAVVDGLFDFVKSNRNLTTSYIKELHAGFCRNQKTTTGVDSLGNVQEIKLIIGDYKKQPNSPTQTDGKLHEYCPPEQTASEMDNLIQLHESHVQKKVSPIVEAAWLHHRFSQIHPFQDGNGRIARALASLILIKAGWFPLTITRDKREEYIDALESADKGSLIPLIKLFAKIQRNTFTSALSIVERVKESIQVSSIIEDIKLQIESKTKREKKSWESAKNMANEVIELASKEMESTAITLKQKLGAFWKGKYPYISKALNGEDQDFYFRNQIIEMARTNGYFANLSLYRSWTRLTIPGKNQSEILISAHGIGPEFRGVIAISACFFSRNKDVEQNGDIGDFTVLGKETFQLTYREKKTDLQKRFLDWFNQILAEGIAFWGKSVLT